MLNTSCIFVIIPAPPRPYIFVDLSPDDSRIAAFAGDQELDIWLFELRRATLTQATFDPTLDSFPTWSPDGRRLFFTSARNGASNIYSQATDGTGTIERISDSPSMQSPTDVLGDGSALIFTERDQRSGDDVMQMTLGDTRRITPLVQTPFSERNGVVAPDRRWLAYESNASGSFEIYVRPFPQTQTGHWRVSTNGGTRPRWAHSNGQLELFYASTSGGIMGVRVEPGSSWTATSPTMVVNEGSVAQTSAGTSRTFDVSADGQRFLVAKEGARDRTPASARLVLVLNWTEELRRLVPPR